jgi:hypothetical protein
MQDLREMMREVGKREKESTTSTVRTPLRVSVPNMQPWDGKASIRKADTFLDDVAWYARESGQVALELLPRMLAAGPRTSWDAVCKRFTDKGLVLSWDDARREFKSMVGETYMRQEEDATREFLDGRVKMAAGQSVADYRTAFDDKMRQVPAMPAEFAVQLFVRGLPAKLAKHCQGDESGRMFTTLEAAFNFAVRAERIERATNETPKGADSSPKAVAALPSDTRDKQVVRGGRGGGRGGRGVFKSSGRGGAHVGGFHGGRGGAFAGGRGGRGARGGAGGGGRGGRGAFSHMYGRCWRCGYPDHQSHQCTAKVDINGNAINDA